MSHPTVELESNAMMSFSYGVGDHLAIVKLVNTAWCLPCSMF